VSVRRHGRRDLGSQPLAEVVGWMREEVAAKRTPSVAWAAAARRSATLPGGKQACVTQPSPSALRCGGRSATRRSHLPAAPARPWSHCTPR